MPRAGVTVTATTIETTTANRYEAAIGGRNAPASLHEERGQQHGDDDQRREEDRAAHLEGGVDHDLPGRRSVTLLPLLADAPRDVVDVDDRVVDQHDERHDEAREHHRVHRGVREEQHGSHAAANDIAIATVLTRALRHWNVNAPSTRISRIAPISAAPSGCRTLCR